ncbi:MAG: low molecular weight phosphotyrosine protein phosphatase [Gammaproteobacteria bacterium]|nr:low molecular weight phosphotyrosine protein phosphatase [Gammaproteobacteria bacterium]
MKKEKIKILFVCMGNICRSPTAHGVFESRVKSEQLTDVIEVDSAGTHSYHIGEKPDRRSQDTAQKHGIDLNYIRSRQVVAHDFSYYDYILAMDNDNYGLLEQACPEQYKDKIALFLEYAPTYLSKEVPDPYYGGATGFDDVFAMVDSASIGLLEVLKKRLD